MVRQSPIDVFQYLDYREFLRDFYHTKKAERRGFSYRAFSLRAGLRSPNHLKRVMDGERNLTQQMAGKFADAIGLRGESAQYFACLADFNQAKDSKGRHHFYLRLTEFRAYRRAHRLDLAQAEYYSSWYVPAICELTMRPDFSDDATWIADQLIPKISSKQAKQGLDTLLELGLLVRTPSGELEQAEAIMSTGAETHGVHIIAYHRAMMERASASIDLLPSTDRDISSLTFCVGEDGLTRIKKRVQEFRKELIAILSQETDGEQVVQLNMQLFPLSKRPEEDESK